LDSITRYGRIVGAVGLAVLVAAAAPAPEPSSASAIEAALGQRDIPRALREYDAHARAHGPSPDLLARIARADLDYCLEEGEGWARLEAARALFDLGDPRGRSALVAALDSPAQPFRLRAAEHLAAHGASEALAPLRRIVADAAAVPYERARAARELYRLGGADQAREVLVALSAADDPRARGQAVAMLASLGDPLSRAALEARLDDPSLLVAVNAAEGLARLGVEAGRARLVQALEMDNLQVTLAVASSLAGLDTPPGVEKLRQIVDGWLAEYPEVPDAVAALVYLYGWVDPKGARPYLERGLGMEKWARMRLLSARRLAEMGDATGLPVLADLYHRYPGADQLPIRLQAVRAAGWLGDRPGVRDLALAAIADDGLQVRMEAIGILSRLAAPESLAPAREILGGPELLPRVQAAEAVLRFGSGPAPGPSAPEDTGTAARLETPPGAGKKADFGVDGVRE
jgi:HEAT repeat protein